MLTGPLILAFLYFVSSWIARVHRSDPLGVHPRVGHALMVLTGLVVFQSWAQPVNSEVPLKLQVVLLKRVFAYDRVLEGQLAPQVFVTYKDKDEQQARIVADLFKEVGTSSQLVPENDLRNLSVPNAVLYLLPGVSPALAQATCERNKLLSVTGDAHLVEEAEASVGIGKRFDGRPEIVVSLKRVKKEGHELSAHLLKLARIIP